MSFDPAVSDGLPRAYVTATHAAFGLGQGESGFVDDSPEVVRAGQLGLIVIHPAPEPGATELVLVNGQPLNPETFDMFAVDDAPQSDETPLDRPQRRRGRPPRQPVPQVDGSL